MIDIPFAKVRQITESAAISVVASKWEEPFGRTALEAHAGGAALISSQSGGLREISGDTAAQLSEVSGPAIASLLVRLASDDALREKLAREGMQRVRRLFSLTRTSRGDPGDVVPICDRLDDFYEEVVERRRAGARAESYRRAV
jgi:glycosyltransferase involved in cell wall biosynthesis